MDWGQIATAGVTSAIVSSTVSLITAITTFRYNRRKDIHASFSTRLEAMRDVVRKIDYLDLHPSPRARSRLWGASKLPDVVDEATPYTGYLQLGWNSFPHSMIRARFRHTK
jgi:hypothetical protein